MWFVQYQVLHYDKYPVHYMFDLTRHLGNNKQTEQKQTNNKSYTVIQDINVDKEM